jgi:thiol-disulfide isomerase/thioredoxin
VAIPLLLFILLGRQVLDKFSILKAHSSILRKIVGTLIIVGALATVWDGLNQYFNISSISYTSASDKVSVSALTNGLAKPYPAPELKGIADWLNSSPMKISNLKGKVVLIDFWTYSCINCVRTLPYITKWDEKYRDKGLVIIGVHSPEFPFESKLNNVKAAVARYNIKYPVALDNNLATWQNFKNQYWPAHYLIDKKGQVVYTHFGEGNYNLTEKNIITLLGVDGQETPVKIVNDETSTRQTPETYLGYGRAERFSSKPALKLNKDTRYTLPKVMEADHWGLSGLWKSSKDATFTKEPKTILKLNFEAKNVFLVLSNTTDHPIKAKILLNGNEVGANAGKDVHNGYLTIAQDALYEIINQNQFTTGQLEIIFEDAGVGVHAFTFGS